MCRVWKTRQIEAFLPSISDFPSVPQLTALTMRQIFVHNEKSGEFYAKQSLRANPRIALFFSFRFFFSSATGT